MKIRKYYILLLVALCISFLSYAQGDMADGYKVFKYPNGNISSEGTLKNGKPDGFWKSYFVTGVKKSEGKRRNFMLDSVWVFYMQTGDTLEKIDYLFGSLN